MQRETSKGIMLGCGVTIVTLKKIIMIWPLQEKSLKENRKGSRRAMKVATAIVQA